MSLEWSVIPPEIKNDRFYHDIVQVLKTYRDHIHTILEIGASSGEGSTEALQLGKQGTDMKLYSLEVARERFVPLCQRYRGDPHFFPINASSIPVGAFPPKNDVIDFLKVRPGPYPVAQVLGWYDNDINYVLVNNINQHGIDQARSLATTPEHPTFDCVLIDGSEFTGWVELGLVYGAKFIMLDDINSFKNYKSNERLRQDPQYQCLVEDRNLRNGYAIYKRTDVPNL